MTENEKCVQDFYSAFQLKDADTMIKYYSDDIIFNDPAFGELKGDEAKSMWKMLCASSKDLSISFEILGSENENVKARWIADYTFSKTSRKVHNVIDAVFTFDKGQIIEHRDNFNLHRWATQAMGWKGRLLGSTSFFKKKLNEQTKYLLNQFMLK